jgi:hypothetical protein
MKFFEHNKSLESVMMGPSFDVKRPRKRNSNRHQFENLTVIEERIQQTVCARCGCIRHLQYATDEKFTMPNGEISHGKAPYCPGKKG